MSSAAKNGKVSKEKKRQNLAVMGVGRGPCPLQFVNFSKKGCFLGFEWEKTNFTNFGPVEKFF